MLKKSYKLSPVFISISNKRICIYLGKTVFFSQPIINSSCIPVHFSPLVYWYAYSYFLALRFGLVSSLKKFKK